MEKPEIAMAYLVVNSKNIIVKGTTAPPPPIPPIVERVIKKINTIRPRNSLPKIGNMPLWTQA
jgi:hypothetical protein